MRERTFQVTFTSRRKVWKFPSCRFVQFDSRDESWCRRLGVGHESTEIVTTTIPRAVITHTVDGITRITAVHCDALEHLRESDERD